MLRKGVPGRGWLIGLVILAGAGVTWWLYQAQRPAPKIPVIIYLVDTLRADRLGVYGYTARATSPVIDALAAESVVFDQAYAPAPWTPPSTASLITSTFLCEHGVLSERSRLDPAHETFAERLGRVGYLTLAIYANVYIRVTGQDQGYEINEPQKIEEYWETGVSVMDERVTRMLDRTTDEPFFWYVHTLEPHDLFRVPIPEILRFGHVSVDERDAYRVAQNNYRYTLGADWQENRPRGTTDQSDRWQPAMDGLRAMHGTIDLLYDASVFWADANVGELVEQLKRRGIWDRAIFVFLSDHGEAFDEHDDWFHEQSVYNELMRIPLVIHFPGSEFGGRRVSAPVSLVDIMPTIMDYLGRPDLCDDCRGASLMRGIRQPGGLENGQTKLVGMRDDLRLYDPRWGPVRGNRNLVVRRDDWKAIWNVDTDSLELYDLAADPGERLDLSAENPAIADEFREYAQQRFEACSLKHAGPTEDQVLDEEVKEQLRALGYL